MLPGSLQKGLRPSRRVYVPKNSASFNTNPLSYAWQRHNLYFLFPVPSRLSLTNVCHFSLLQASVTHSF